jgi:hypothetical protein
LTLFFNFQEEAASSKSAIIKQLREADAKKKKSHASDKHIPGSLSYEVNFPFHSYHLLSIDCSGYRRLRCYA